MVLHFIFFATFFYNLHRESLKRGKYPNHHIDENERSKKRKKIKTDKKSKLNRGRNITLDTDGIGNLTRKIQNFKYSFQSIGFDESEDDSEIDSESPHNVMHDPIKEIVVIGFEYPSIPVVPPPDNLNRIVSDRKDE